MFDNVRNRIKRAAQFAERHHTLVACTATGIITWKVTRSATFKEAFREVSAYVDAIEKEASDYVYEVGRENGRLLLQNRVMLDFINERRLDEDLKEHILSMKQ